MSVEHTLHVQHEGYLKPHNEVGSKSPSWLSPSLGFELTTFQFCLLCAIPPFQPPHIKNKKNKKNNIWKIRILLWFTQPEIISGQLKCPLCCTESFFGHTGTFIFCALEWNWWAPTIVAGTVRKSFKIYSIWIGLKRTSK